MWKNDLGLLLAAVILSLLVTIFHYRLGIGGVHHFFDIFSLFSFLLAFFFFWFFVFLRQAQTRTLRDHLFFLGALRIFRHWSWYYPWSNPLPWDLVREGCRPLSHNLAALRSRMLKDRQYPSHRMDIVYVFFFFGGEGLCDIRC